jgi:multidrug efflux system outer membrane protein
VRRRGTVCSQHSSAAAAGRGFCCAVLAACLAGGCNLHPVAGPVRPAVGAGEAFSISVDGVEPAHRWWRALGDDRLTDRIEAALSDSLDLRQARLRIEQSAALERRAASRLLPMVDAGAGADREWPDKGVTHADRLSGSGLLSWEADLWGRLSSAREAASRETIAAREDLQATALLLSAEVAEAYFGIVEQRLQLALLDEQIEVGRTLLGLIELRFGQGQASVVDVYQ